MHQLAFTKMSGAGNDFVVADGRDGVGLALLRGNTAAFVAAVCHRRFSVGADGVLLVQAADPGSGDDFRMRYFNADGGEAEMCGNGARCISRYALRLGLGGDGSVRFATMAGPHAASLVGEDVRVAMLPPSGVRTGVEVEAAGRRFTGSYLNTGVPHYVVWCEDLETADVVIWGRALRHHAEFAPAGANVDFVQRHGDGLRVRTYERGVEDETLACGTGLTASALAGAIRWGLPSPVRLRAQSGLDLFVSFAREGDVFDGVHLQGEARFVYDGRYPVRDAWLRAADVPAGTAREG